jgi:glycosyltransferase involved in cell wall biosynthesis
MDAFLQVMPDLAAYRAGLIAEGAVHPLAPVPSPPGGLLADLPLPAAPGRGWPWDRETPRPSGPAEAWPRITVVIPSFQQARYLEAALRSVLLQNYPRLECIVADGGSSDGSLEILNRYRPWLSHARVGRDRGQAHAINLGFSLGSGELFGWLNSDDFYLPGALRRVAESRRRTGADFVYGDAMVLDQESGSLCQEISSFAAGRYVRFPGLVPSHASFWAAARHRPVWEEQHCALDYELWIRLLPGLRTAHVRWPLGVYRRHAAAKSFDPEVAGRWRDDERRNGLAHPGLYRPGIRSRLLRLAFRAVQRIARGLRSRGSAARCRAVFRECGWDAPTP